MKLKKNNLLAIVGSILFHAVILLILYFTVLKAVEPEEDGGVMVNFGTIDEATGTFDPEGEPAQDEPTEEVQEETVVPPPPTPPAPPTPPTPPTPKQPEKLITQDQEESVALAQQRKKEQERKRKEEARRQEELRKQQEERQRQDTERRRQDEARRKEAEQKAEAERQAEAERRRQAEEQRKKEQAIRDRVAGAFGKNNSSQGTGKTTTGNQGSPLGNADRGANKGVGTGFSLSGRSIGAGGLPHPAYTVQEEGRIVVNIVVDPAGNVIAADIGKGTNIDNASMRRSAVEAARRAKFNSIEGTNNQSGTITYMFRLK